MNIFAFWHFISHARKISFTTRHTPFTFISYLNLTTKETTLCEVLRLFFLLHRIFEQPKEVSYKTTNKKQTNFATFCLLPLNY